jgi:hypothetical protein
MNLAVALYALDEMAQILGITEKSVASVARRFRADLRGLVVLGLTGDGGSILADVRRIVKDGVGDAYIAGLADCGVSFDEMDSDDAMMIVELTTRQMEHVTDFVKAIREARGDQIAERAVLDRVDLWTASIESAGEAGKASGCGNELMRFVLDPDQEDSKESCATCKRLLGTTMRRKTIIAKGLLIQPGNTNFECGAWRCPHIWVPAKNGSKKE